MRSPTFLLALALGLRPWLTGASHCDNVAIERLPVYATSDGPFILRAQEGFNVFLKYDSDHKAYIPVISKKDKDLPEFDLKHGNLTALEGKVAAVYGPVPAIHPPALLPLIFVHESAGKPGAEVVLVTKTRSDGSGREVLRVFPLNGRKLGMLIFLPEARRWIT